MPAERWFPGAYHNGENVRNDSCCFQIYCRDLKLCAAVCYDPVFHDLAGFGCRGTDAGARLRTKFAWAEPYGSEPGAGFFRNDADRAGADPDVTDTGSTGRAGCACDASGAEVAGVRGIFLVPRVSGPLEQHQF